MWMVKWLATKAKERKVGRDTSRMPENSVFYEKIVPVLLIVLGVAMMVLILVIVGAWLGFMP